jgi:hypothetical protein
VTLEDVGDDQKSKPVMTFRNRSKGLVVNATNYDTIADVYGDETSNWPGQSIELFPTKVDFKGKRTDAIRVRIPGAAPAPVKQAPAAPSSDMNDEIPF